MTELCEVVEAARRDAGVAKGRDYSKTAIVWVSEPEVESDNHPAEGRRVLCFCEIHVIHLIWGYSDLN